MLIAGLNKTTLLDYPGRVAAAVFVSGCNFRCPFCHNGGIVLEPFSQKSYTETEIFAFLEKRKNVLKGVCITGGEPTLYDDLPEFVERVRALGYQVKLDTNGYAPKLLKELLKKHLLDYVAMDIKNCPKKYALTVGMCRKAEEKGSNGQMKFQMDQIRESVSALKESGIDYEFRTTVVKELHTRDDLLEIADWIKGCPRYFLQLYQDNENVIYSVLHRGGERKKWEDETDFEGFHGYGKAEMEELAEMLQAVPGMTGKVYLRGVD